MIRLRGIREGEHPLDITVDPATLGVEDAIRPISVVGSLLASDSYVFRLTVSTTLRHTCDRCADEFDASYVVPLTVTYTPAEEGIELEDTGYVHSFDPQMLFEVDLTEDVHDALLLAVPMKKLCSPDCKGLTQESAPAPSVDERFSALGALYERLRSEEKPG
ncbi:MAG: DUF177 domain-containing protein [Bacteroidetes bacterium]|nr:DUF177 domain-containing protein [Bacteroidota bacterium]